MVKTGCLVHDLADSDVSLSFVGIIFQLREKIDYFFIYGPDISFVDSDPDQKRNDAFCERLIIEQVVCRMLVEEPLVNGPVIFGDDDGIDAGIVFYIGGCVDSQLGIPVYGGGQ